MAKRFDIRDYSTGGRASWYSGIPMKYLELVKDIMASREMDVRIRYRGPRRTQLVNRGGQWVRRMTHSGQSECIKSMAESFAVYGRS